MNFLDFVIDCYTHITSHVTQVFTSCTHYTSYSLLNIVHVIVCVFWSDQLSLKLLWVFFLCKTYFVFEILKGEFFENLKFRKTRFKTYVLKKHFISYSCILFLIFNALRSVFKNHIIFSKMLFFRFSIDPICFLINQNFFWNSLWAFVCFNQSKMIFNQSKIVNKLF